TFGAIHPDGSNWVREQINYIRSQTEKPFGIGFITHFIPDALASFEVALEERVPVIAFSFADPGPWLQRAKDSGATTLCQIQTLKDAREAVAAGADVLVAQGNEAGGHTGRMSLLPFLTRLLDEFPDLPVMASGGISNGRALAAILSAGADGAWVGTPFLATPEAVEVPEAFKNRVVDSDGEDTIFTRVYDVLGDSPWPEGIAGRVYHNRFVQKWDGRDDEIRDRREELISDAAEAWANADTEMASVYMGESAGSVTAIRQASEVLRGICDQAEKVLRERSDQLLYR
ncbi:MAG: nitronate monooxygenase, partial [Dehalococcoidia bacterium]